MKTHELKTWPSYFAGLRDGTKTFEVRKNDRAFEVGDELLLREWKPVGEEYTGSVEIRRITCVLQGGQFGIEPGFVVMGIQRAGKTATEIVAVAGMKMAADKLRQLEQRVDLVRNSPVFAGAINVLEKTALDYRLSADGALVDDFAKARFVACAANLESAASMLRILWREYDAYPGSRQETLTKPPSEA